jgi:hypothetical protein
MVDSYMLRRRITACAAQEKVTDPERWVNANKWKFPGSDWVAAWDYYLSANPEATDPGADSACITDQMILSSVQAIITPPAPPQEPVPEESTEETTTEEVITGG